MIQIREIFSELIWGKVEENKNGEKKFKIGYDNLEIDKSKVEPDLIRYSEFLDDKYKLMTEEEFSKIENPEKTLEEINNEIKSNRIQELCDITEHHHPGFKFKRLFENNYLSSL